MAGELRSEEKYSHVGSLRIHIPIIDIAPGEDEERSLMRRSMSIFLNVFEKEKIDFHAHHFRATDSSRQSHLSDILARSRGQK